MEDHQTFRKVNKNLLLRMNPFKLHFKAALEFRTDDSHLLVLKLKFLVHFFIFLQRHPAFIFII
jgi:hypothetical protein